MDTKKRARSALLWRAAACSGVAPPSAGATCAETKPVRGITARRPRGGAATCPQSNGLLNIPPGEIRDRPDPGVDDRARGADRVGVRASHDE